MKDIWDKPITADTDWGGDASTGGLPVSGRIVQEYIKSRLKTDDQLKAFIKAYLDENGMSEDQGYVTLATEQTIKAIKDFEAGLKIGGSLITYDKDLNAFILRANLVTEGGITARALLDEVDVPTFMDGVVTDEVTISKADGVLRVLKAGLDKEELINILEEEKYVTQSWVKSYNAEELKKYVLKTDLPSDIVTLSIDQEITGIKNFANGFEIAGIKFSKSQDGTIFLDGNLVTSGGITARGTNETVTPSIFEALPIDGDTIKRTADGRLYVDADALNISGGGGVADSVSWENVTGKPSWIGSTKPTYTASEVEALPITGGTLKGKVLASAFVNTINWVSDTGQVRANCEGTNYYIGVGATSGGYAVIQGGNSGVGAIPLLLNPSGGNVAIGGTTASARLDVTATSGWCTSFTNTNAIVAASHRDGHGIFIGSTIPTTSSNYIFRVWQGSLTDASNTGTAIFDVMANNSVIARANFLATGGITARYTSDMRLKQNRRSFKASEVLMSLGAVQQFEYIPSEVEKNKIYEGIHIGLIYQNVVGTALNRMCHEREDGYGSLNYLEPSFISLLAGVGQEHEVRIQQLERENKALRKEIEYLQQRVA